MGRCAVTYRELRFVIEDELTHVYVHLQADGDCPLGVQGWHHKVFPPSKSVKDILELMFNKNDDPVMWGQEAPKQ